MLSLIFLEITDCKLNPQVGELSIFAKAYQKGKVQNPPQSGSDSLIQRWKFSHPRKKKTCVWSPLQKQLLYFVFNTSEIKKAVGLGV